MGKRGQQRFAPRESGRPLPAQPMAPSVGLLPRVRNRSTKSSSRGTRSAASYLRRGHFQTLLSAYNSLVLHRAQPRNFNLVFRLEDLGDEGWIERKFG